MKINTKKSNNTLKRYTTIGSAIDTLKNMHVAFVDPDNWDDRNDAEYMRLYKEGRNLSNLKALCCTESPETCHHWKVFTNSTDGCYIEFDKNQIISSLKGNKDYLNNPMNYVYLKDMKKNNYQIDDLPFLKRHGFKPEREFRFIYIGNCNDDVHFMKIDLKWITQIVLNPWLPKSVANSIKDTLRPENTELNLRVRTSQLINSQIWNRHGQAIVNRNK